jgi:hypothetical protein
MRSVVEGLEVAAVLVATTPEVAEAVAQHIVHFECSLVINSATRSAKVVLRPLQTVTQAGRLRWRSVATP